jgi:uncharacterized protein (TIGR02996 family)
MTDEEALLAAIRENPGENTPKLALADLLESQGEEDRAFWWKAVGGWKVADADVRILSGPPLDLVLLLTTSDPTYAPSATDSTVVIDKETAYQIAMSQEMQEYLARSPVRISDILECGRNAEYGLPDAIYGFDLVVRPGRAIDGKMLWLRVGNRSVDVNWPDIQPFLNYESPHLAEMDVSYAHPPIQRCLYHCRVNEVNFIRFPGNWKIIKELVWREPKESDPIALRGGSIEGGLPLSRRSTEAATATARASG